MRMLDDLDNSFLEAFSVVPPNGTSFIHIYVFINLDLFNLSNMKQKHLQY